MALQRIVTKVRNVGRGIAQGYAPARIKKLLWDSEYASGRWNCLENMAGDCLYPYIEKYANRGSILDLGCGPGATGNELNADAYSSYTGVDISEVAIEKARTRSEQNHRSAKNQYVVSDISSYVPSNPHDLIVLGDSIYYISRLRIGSVLKRYSKYLKDGGAFIVRIRGSYPSPYLSIIQSHFSVIEQQLHYNSEICVVVFRP